MFNNQIIAGSSGQGGGGFYSTTIDQSLRFNDGDSPYLNFTPSSASNQKTWTYSLWVKRTTLGVRQALISAGTSGGLAKISIWKFRPIRVFTPSNTYLFITSRKFRDPAAWYHIVLRVDTTQSSANDRTRLYVNGTNNVFFN